MGRERTYTCHDATTRLLFKKNLNAAKPPEQSKGLGIIGTLAVRTKTLPGTWY